MADRVALAVLLTAVLATGCRPVASDSCRVTRPNGQVFSGAQPGGNHGNDYLVTALWSEGTVAFSPGGPGVLLPDGALAMKFPWWRRVEGKLSIEGRRLDGPARALRSEISAGYGSTGLQASALIFPSVGCWEVTGRVDGGSLTFVTRIVERGVPY